MTASPLPDSGPNISKLLEISTAHVPFSASEDCESWAYGEFNQGIWSYVPAKPFEDHYAPYGGLPEWLKAVHDFARKYGCSWVLFDADAAIEEDLPNFSDTWP